MYKCAPIPYSTMLPVITVKSIPPWCGICNQNHTSFGPSSVWALGHFRSTIMEVLSCPTHFDCTTHTHTYNTQKNYITHWTAAKCRRDFLIHISPAQQSTTSLCDRENYVIRLNAYLTFSACDWPENYSG